MRMVPWLILAACGDSPTSPDAAPGDGAGTGDTGPLPPGVHVFQVDLADETTDPTGSWVLVPFSAQNGTVSALVDWATGQPTAVSLSTSGWSSQGTAPQNWTAGTVGWLPALVAEDAYGGSASTPGTATFTGLDGRYRVEVVVAYGFATTDHRVEVNGTTTTTTRGGATGVDSATWDPRTQGTDRGDWLVWPDVAPDRGSIAVSVVPGRLNAIRLAPP